MLQSVTIEFIRSDYAGSAFERLFSRSTALQARCNHPCVTRLLDHGTDSRGSIYRVEEFHSGRPITEVADGRTLVLRARLDLLAHAAEAVHAVHACGVIHRDIKPRHVVVVDHGFGELFVKLGGFGISQPMGRDVMLKTGDMLGTMEYASPEQFDGAWDRVDQRSDVYSLGCVAYEVLCGCRFRDVDPWSVGFAEWEESIRHGVVVPPSGRIVALLQSDGAEAGRLATLRQTMPQDLVRALREKVDPIVLRATQAKREDRYASALEMARDLRGAAERLASPRRRWLWW